ncbi:MAG: FHA domain-containing protein [Myxococcota bacterium]
MSSTFLVGRSRSCHLRLEDSIVSSQHASIAWQHAQWVVRDLASRNGTFVDGERLEPGVPRTLKKNARISFGDARWTYELSDDTEPSTMAFPVDGGAPVVMRDGVLALPTPEQPEVNIYNMPDGRWVLERADDLIDIEDQQGFIAGGQGWRFCAPEISGPETDVSQFVPSLVSDAELHFAVSRDEEHVELKVKHRGRMIDLGSRAHHYLLLTLGRYRMEDRTDAQAAPSEEGWIYQDELQKMLRIPAGRLNLDVYRVRQQFGSAGFANPANIIERRPRTKQLRIGSATIEVETI